MIMKDDIGLSEHTTKHVWGKSQIEMERPVMRSVGNKLIEEIVGMSKRQNPELSDYMIHSSHVYNEYETVQKALSYSKDAIETLMEWSEDGNPKTWKWLSPIVLENEDGLKAFDSHNLSWLTDAYKGKMVIGLVTPDEFLKLATQYPNDDLIKFEHSKKNIDKLSAKMMKGTPIDTMYLIVKEDGQVISHEGRHRAYAAKLAGIQYVPIYIYRNGGSHTDHEMERFSKRPYQELRGYKDR